ncbi:hypothetical protein GGX14DRAFT_407968 [Mycena pura]|uniref:Uncharacterized protein n=1 Tax=Mycena pura TaxID=153505 RepID=A0AAD6UR79_9AGAR|nr:hypothetical protein GGX14DRAFT_407968 [Mycena pura]
MAKIKARNEVATANDVPAYLDLNMEDLTLGFALLPYLAHMMKDEKTPQIVPGLYDRPRRAYALANLRNIGYSGLQPNVHEHALLMAVKPSKIDMSSLTTDIKATPQTARFLGDDPSQIKLVRLAGQHRILYGEEVFGKTLKLIERLEKSNKERDIADVRDARATIRTTPMWLVKFINEDMLLQKKWADVYYFLSSNNKVQAVGEKLEHSIAGLLGRYRIKAPGEIDPGFTKWKTTVSGLTSVGPIVGRHGNALEFLAPIHGYAGFDDQSIQPKQIEKLKASGWAVFKLFLESLFTDFENLITPPLPEHAGSPDWVATIRVDPSQDVDPSQNDDPDNDGTGPQRRIGNLLLPIFDEAFKHAFLDVDDRAWNFFGFHNSSRYSAAYEQFAVEVLEECSKMADHLEDATVAEKQVLDVLRERLQALLDRTDTTYPNPPVRSPLLCPSVLIKLAELFIVLGPAFAMMSHIIGPGRLEYLGERKSTTKDSGIPSLTCHALVHLRHFEGMGLDADWELREVDKSNDSQALIGNVLAMRVAVTPMLGKFQATLAQRMKPEDYSIAESLQTVKDDMVRAQGRWQTYGLAIGRTLHEARKKGSGSKVALTTLVPRNMQHLPVSHIASFPQVVKDVIENLGYHPVDHLLCGRPNGPGVRARMSGHALHELQLLEHFFKPMFRENEAAEMFRQMVRTTIVANPRFVNYEHWFDLSTRWTYAPSLLTSYSDNDVLSLEAELAHQASQDTLTTGFKTIVNVLRRLDECVFPITIYGEEDRRGAAKETKLRLFDPRLKDPLEALFEAMHKPKSRGEPLEEEIDEWTTEQKGSMICKVQFAELMTLPGDEEADEGDDEEPENSNANPADTGNEDAEGSSDEDADKPSPQLPAMASSALPVNESAGELSMWKDLGSTPDSVPSPPPSNQLVSTSAVVRALSEEDDDGPPPSQEAEGFQNSYRERQEEGQACLSRGFYLFCFKCVPLWTL